ncbi:MAG: tRNA (guanosine(46)-N7)-methyltransferase TrmB [Candidatus Kapabacteria bacterium]|nr:tRNA (guanosine(46)-N7)-methyltransferase TrmB [Candidatus Kapabacteria bacterium]
MEEVDLKKYPFNHRLRHHTAPNLYFSIQELKYQPENYPLPLDSVNWEQIYSNKNPPDMLDIGCGRGIFLLNTALNNSEKNILGIEIRKGLTDWISEIVKGENIGNCAVLWYSVTNGIKFIQDESIESAFYLFPDPWYKRRHVKRRAFDLDFLNEVHRVLKPNGRLYLATDVEEINEYHKSTLQKFQKLKFNIIIDNSEWKLLSTNKENFCSANKIPIYRIIATK